MRKGDQNKGPRNADVGTGDTSAPSCDWGSKAAGKRATGSSSTKHKHSSAKAPGRTRLHRFDGKGGWSGVKKEAYKKPDGSWADVVRHTLIGTKGENTDFHLRYFEVAPGGMTSLERHEHEHVVVGVRGEGTCLVRRKDYEIGFMDVIYIPPGAPHQLRNRGSASFGFFCIVDSDRDRPVLLPKSLEKKKVRGE